MKSSSSILFSFLFLAVMTSCEKVIEDAETKLVIKGNITNQTHPYNVRVAQSTDLMPRDRGM
jgi:hypothetical protein